MDERLTLVPHRWPGAALRATLIERPNKFLAVCALPSGAAVEAHVPDRGRCLDLLVPGQPLVLVEAAGALRRTRFTCLLAESKSAPGTWVCLDPAGAPRLVEAALDAGLLDSLAGHRVLRREVSVRRSRIDLLLQAPDGAEVLCEVKSVGAARDGVACFPDAPTERGARHLALLAARARKGHRTAVVLCAQRGDVHAISADAAIDPAFAAALHRARRAGVLVAGLACAALPDGMKLLREVPVLATGSARTRAPARSPGPARRRSG
jgi:sugar fermentation stimulation protein A